MLNFCDFIEVYVFTTNLHLKGPIITAADDIHKYCFHCFLEKIRLDVRGFT